MRQLVIDTATEALSVALFDNGNLLASHHEIAGRGHAEKLIPLLCSMDDGGRSDEIIVNSGPGSFTGVRVGLAAARALAYAWQADLRAYGSLFLVAAMAREMEAEETAPAPSPTITIVMNGGHGEIFWQIFRRDDLSPLTALTSTPIPRLALEIGAAPFYGSAASTLIEKMDLTEEKRASCRAVPLHPDARFFPLLPETALSMDSTPLYGRGADAVPQAPRKIAG